MVRREPAGEEGDQKSIPMSRANSNFFNRKLSRDSSLGCSSRISYYREAEGVPFQWETQPGKPRDRNPEEVLPPLSPPPALRSLGLPKPAIEEHPKSQTWHWLRFWKKKTRNRVSRRKEQLPAVSERFEFCGYGDSESKETSSRSSSSSSAMSLPVECPLVKIPGRRDSCEKRFICSPWAVRRVH